MKKWLLFHRPFLDLSLSPLVKKDTEKCHPLLSEPACLVWDKILMGKLGR